MKKLTDAGFVSIINDGASIQETNYFDMDAAKEGILFFSVNGGCIRLLIPDSQNGLITEIKTGNEVILSRGNLDTANGPASGIEILFDDHTDNPFSITVSLEQFDMVPEPDDRWQFAAYTRAGAVWQCDRCMVRMVDTLPCLKPWG